MKLLNLIFLLLFSMSSMAETSQPEALFALGVKSFAEQKYTDAQTHFESVLKHDPKHVDTIVNLALVQLKLNRIGYALGYLRQAQAIDPSNQKISQSFKYIEKHIQVRFLPTHHDFMGELRENIFKTISLHAILLITAMTFLFSGIIILNFFARRKVAILEEKSTPPFPYIGTILIILFVISTVFAVLKKVDQNIKRATLITEKSEIKLAPSDTEPTLFEIFEGQEVIIEKQQNDWSLIEVNEEQSGWLKTEFLLKQN